MSVCVLHGNHGLDEVVGILSQKFMYLFSWFTLTIKIVSALETCTKAVSWEFEIEFCVVTSLLV